MNKVKVAKFTNSELRSWSVKQLRNYLASIEDYKKRYPKMNYSNLEQQIQFHIPNAMLREFEGRKSIEEQIEEKRINPSISPKEKINRIIKQAEKNRKQNAYMRTPYGGRRTRRNKKSKRSTRRR